MIEDELGALLAEHADRHSVPGAAIGILHRGVVTTASYGTANVVTGEAVTAETRFSAGSLTKSMVATVIAVLADAGRLSLDDPVSAHVPELRGAGWAERATVLDLLANRSGLPLTSALEFGFGAHRDTDDRALARLVAEIDADLPASTVWSYTNVGWCVLGRVIETVTGDTWEVAMRHLLFDRAGMTSTTFAIGSEPVRRVMGHDITRDGAVAVEPLVARAYGPAGTSVISTVTDLLRFAALHLEEPSLAALRAVQADVSIHGWFDAWCLGWARFEWEGGEALGVGRSHQRRAIGAADRAGPRRRHRPADEQQCGPCAAIARSSPSSCAGSSGSPSRHSASTHRPAARAISPASPASTAGRTATIEVTVAGRGLRMREEGRETEALPIDERVFLVDALDPDNPTVTFGAFDAAGRPNVLYDMLWGLPRLRIGG